MTSRRTVRLWLGIVWILLVNACLPVDASNLNPKTCQVHHVLLQADRVHVEYGQVALGEASPIYLQANKRLFPNANTFLWGGHVMYSNSPDMANVLFCPECRAAEQTYLADWEQRYSPGTINSRLVQANLDKAQKTLQQMIDFFDGIQQRQQFPSPQLTPAQEEENVALDIILNDLLHSEQVSAYERHKLLFNTQAWPTYKPQLPQLLLADFRLVSKQVDEATKNLDAVMKLLSHNMEWNKALDTLYPDWKLYVSSCNLNHAGNTLHVTLGWGLSAHGAMADYVLIKEQGKWRVSKRDIAWYV